MERRWLSGVRRRPTVGAGAPRVILVHGLRGTKYNWNSSKRSFQRSLVEAGYSTVCPELRGSGASRALGSPPPRSILELLELDLLPLIEQEARGSQAGVILIGHSLGGILSCLAAAASPEQVAAVVTLGSPLTIGVDQPLIRLGARIWVAVSGAESLRGWAESEKMGRRLIAARRLKDRLRIPPRVTSYYPGSMEPELEAEFEEHNDPEPAFPGLLRDLSRLSLGRSPEGMEIEGELSRVRAPLLSVAADRDQLAPPEAARALFEAVGSEDKSWMVAGEPEVHLGHTDMILGTEAPRMVWEPVRVWLEVRCRDGRIPPGV